MRPLIMGMAALLCLPGTAAAAAVSEEPRAAVRIPCDRPVHVALQAASAVGLTIAHAGLLQADATDQDLWLEGPDIEALASVAVPPRLGTTWARVRSPGVVRVKGALPGRPAGTLAVRLHCAPDAARLDTLAWYERAAPLSAQLRDRVLRDAASVPPALDALIASAPGPKERALALHLRAQTFYVAGDSTRAAAAFGAAEEAWWAAGQPERSLAARVGRIEDLNRAGRYEEALTAALDARRVTNPSSYFAIRQTNDACLALQYLHRLEESNTCFDDVVRRLAARGETDEWLSTRQDHARLVYQLGDSARAEAIGRDVLRSAGALDNPVVLGRTYLMLGEFALGRGALQEGIVAFEQSLLQFERYRDARWEANVLMRLAAVFSAVGAIEDGYDFAEAALRRLEPGNAPARLAHALREVAGVSRRAGRPHDARLWAEQAARLFGELGLQNERAETRADIAQAYWEGGEPEQARSILDEDVDASAGSTLRALIRAEMALESGSIDDAQRLLRTIGQGSALGADQHLRVAQLRAHVLAAQGDCAGGEAHLFEVATDLRAAADAVNNPLLAELLAGRVGALRRAAVDMLTDPQALSCADPARLPARLWDWAHLTATDASPSPASATASRWDADVAQELLAPVGVTRPLTPPADTGATLVQLLGDTGSDKPRPPMSRRITLEAVRGHLPPGHLMLAAVEGKARTALLYVTGDTVRTQAVSSSELRTAARGLRDAVSARDGSVALPAATVADLILAVVADQPPPSRLLVAADSVLAEIPWPVLPWPPRGPMLVETSDLSLVQVTADPPPRASDTGVDVFVAAQMGGEGGLRPLPSATLEPSRIASAIHDREVREQLGPATSRGSLLGSLGTPGRWVHVAAHGTERSQHLGRTGLWLDAPFPGTQPQFVSWMELHQRGVAAELVVLNACNLGDTTASSISAETGFASAMSRAGATHVVASLWNVSDAAAALWVPSFYTSLEQEDAVRPSHALRNAQTRLRTSIMFRHPFYWASLVHFERWTVPGGAFAGQVTGTVPKAPGTTAGRR